MRKHGVFFVLGLRPTGSRGFGCDRCQWQMKGAAKGEETGRADDHVRKEISFPLEKTEKSVCTIPLVAQSARSEDGKHRRLFLMRWVFAGSNSCPPEDYEDIQAALQCKVLAPLRNSKNIMRKHGVFLFWAVTSPKCFLYFFLPQPFFPIISISFSLFSRNFLLLFPVYYLIRPYHNCIFPSFSL